MRFLPLLLLAWPLAEIAVFVIVGGKIGVLSTIGLILATAVAGSLLLRFQGFGVLRRIQAEIDAGRDPGRELANGAMILFAGILLLLPGFITDVIGILLFIPPVRNAVWRGLKGRVGSFTYYGPTRSEAGKNARTIDLDPDDYTSEGDPESPWRRIDRDG